MDIKNSKYEIVLTDMANNDLEEIYNYISDNLKEKNIAFKLMNKIEQDFSRLEEFPYSCMEVNIKPRNKNYRKLVTGNYIALYKVNEEIKQVTIHHVFYSKRDYLE